jgi:hypothetical protein
MAGAVSSRRNVSHSGIAVIAMKNAAPSGTVIQSQFMSILPSGASMLAGHTPRVGSQLLKRL